VPAPLLQTKLFVPRSRRGLVPRPRLTERLDRGAASKLMILSAPAGFGKTTLLAEWLTAGSATPTNDRSAAWLSLDQGDDDPATFWTYVIAALQTVAPGVGADTLTLLQEPQPPPIQTVVTTLLNDLGAIADDVVLVLDDYQVIDERDVQDGMAFLLDHLPPQLHLVIASRADPALPLARLRARGELVETRAADLRFTPDEAATYLNEMMRLSLTAQDVATLEGRTEGWIAALQLAALSMQGRDDIAAFIAGFAGDDRYIVDYLAEEVLQRQPEHVRSFLLQTSILDRLTGSLCDAVIGQDGGKAMLNALERGNLFLVPLDDRRRWYRYHQLFADVLRARLLDEQPDGVGELHRRASDWYEQHGERSEAIRHAMAGEDFEWAANLVELAMPGLRQGRQDATLRGWLEALPEEVIRVRPVLSVAYVGALMVSGELEGVEARLRDAERWLATPRDIGEEPQALSAGMVVVDEEAFRDLPGAIAIYRAGQARILGDVAGTIAHARRALELVGEEDHFGRGAAAAFLGLAYWTGGDLDEAQRWYADGMASLEKAGYLSDVIGGAITLADIRITQGRLGEAMSAYERGLRVATEHAAPALRGAADMHVGMSRIFYERNELDAAMQHLLTSRELGEHAGLPPNRYRWRVAMARIRAAEGDLGGALDLLNEADRLYVSDFSPDVRPVPALRARVWLSQGRWGDALGWARERGLSVEDDVSYLREFEHLTLARVLLARDRAERSGGSIHEVTSLLERLLRAAQEGARTGSVLEILVLQALAQETQGDIPAGLASLQQALTLAEPEGYVRTFIDEGPPMAPLLKVAAKQRTAPGYVRRLLAAVNKTGDAAPVQPGLIEPLSERELDVLRLLGTDLNGPDIARELIVSLSTVRTHTNRIYAKLGVNNRRAAVRRARELDLLSRTRDR
jgi:LuxR family transcriptional regulator, maltose regulon positive regulatory protein